MTNVVRYDPAAANRLPRSFDSVTYLIGWRGSNPPGCSCVPARNKRTDIFANLRYAVRRRTSMTTTITITRTSTAAPTTTVCIGDSPRVAPSIPMRSTRNLFLY